MNLSDFTDIAINSQSVEDIWQTLVLELDSHGFDRIIFARKPRAELANFHNISDIMVLTNYDPGILDVFFDGRGYTQDITTLWALENEGAVSWSVSRNSFLSGEMSASQRKIHLATREAGLIAGYTYSIPGGGSGVRSGFGLCYREGASQEEVDDIWRRRSTSIVPMLQVFEMTVSRIPYVPVGQELDDRKIQILRHIADGKTVADTAELLGLHRRTVESQLTSARERLGVSTTLQATLKASRQGQL